MSEYKIEKGIPITGKALHGSIRDLAIQMEVGDSVLCPPCGNGLTRFSNTALAIVLRKMGRKATCRREGDMVRTWRVA